MNRLESKLNISVKHFYSKEAKWGGYDSKTGNATGMASFLTDGKADVISSFYTITRERFNVVDFMFPCFDFRFAFAVKSKPQFGLSEV